MPIAKKKIPKFLKLYKAGYSDYKIAKELGVSRTSARDQRHYLKLVANFKAPYKHKNLEENQLITRAWADRLRSSNRILRGIIKLAKKEELDFTYQELTNCLIRINKNSKLLLSLIKLKRISGGIK